MTKPIITAAATLPITIPAIAPPPSPLDIWLELTTNNESEDPSIMAIWLEVRVKELLMAL